MIYKASLVLLIAVGCSSGCATQDRRGPTSRCEVHHVDMCSVTVPLVVGWVDHFDANYSEAARKLFPHVPPEGPTAKRKRERVYVCDECIQARQAWLQLQNKP